MTAHADVIFRGNARDITQAGRQAERAVGGVGRTARTSATHIDAMGASSEKQRRKVVGFGNAANLAFGAAGLAYGISRSVKAFQEQEKASANVSASLKTLGIDNEKTRRRIDETTLAQQRLSGVADEKLQVSFATLLRSTGDVSTALKGNNLALDIARARGLDVTKVAQVLAKVYDGNVGILKRYGVAVEKGATIEQALAAARKRYAGQAKAYGETTAGAAEKAASEFNNLEEAIGSKFAPALNAAAGGILGVTSAVDGLASSVGGLGPIVAGAAGFGAFQLATPVVGKFGGLLSNIASQSKLGGGGIKGLAGAIGASVSPMGLAAVGAGLLAGGIYAIWRNSESADQAVQGLNSTLRDTQAARGQQETAKNNVNAAKDYVRATKDSVAQARAITRALHGEAEARKADVTELEKHGASSIKVESAQKKADAATKKWRKSFDDITTAVHANQTATTNLKSAQDNFRSSTDGVNAALGEQDRKSRDVIGKAKDAAQAASGVAGKYGHLGSVFNSSRLEAEKFAGMMDKAAAATKNTDTQTRIADQNLAAFARRIGRVPSVKEIRIVTKLSQQGLTLNEIERRLARIRSKEVTVRFNSTFNVPTGLTPPPPKPPKPPFKSATGAWVAGRYGDGDRHLAMLAGEEAVLNPGQIDEVGRGRVMHALRNAPTIGNGFAQGKKPRAVDGSYAGNTLQRKRGQWYYHYRQGEPVPIPRGTPEELREFFMSFAGSGISPAQARGAADWWAAHYRGGRIYGDPNGGLYSYATGAKPRGGAATSVAGSSGGRSQAGTAGGIAARITKALDTRRTSWDLASARARLRIATADAAGDPTGNALAYEFEAASEDATARAIRAIITNPAKALGVKGGKLTLSQRATLLQALASAISQAKSDRDTAYQLRHPAAEEGEAPAGGDTAAEGGPAGPTPDQQAVTQQLQERLALATRGAALSEASLRALTSSGDISQSGYGNALQAAAGAPRLAVILADQRMATALAGVAVQGFAGQPAVTANRVFVGI